LTLKRARPSVAVSIEHLDAPGVDGKKLAAALAAAAERRGFVAADPGDASMRVGAEGKGSYARTTFGAWSHGIVVAAARALKKPLVHVVVRGDAKDISKRLTMSFTVRVSDIGKDGSVTSRDPALLADPDLEYADPQVAAAPWDLADLERAGYDHAGQILGRVMGALSLRAADAKETRRSFTRPALSGRLVDLADLVATTRDFVAEPQPDGRFIVRVTAGGVKRVAYLTAGELADLRKLGGAD
jgi:hypothetical protein